MPGPQRNTATKNSRAFRSGGNRKITVLPAEGCTLPVPKIPRGRTWTSVERARWKELWTSPQATEWDETAKGTVALLVSYESRLLDNNDGGSAWVAAEARHAADALGLTPRSMAALGWVVEDE